MTTDSDLAIQGLIFEIQKLSTEDGPGIRTTVFLKECPLHCVWCHNPESISKQPSIQWFKVKCIGCETCVIACPNKALKLDKEGLHIDRNKCQACGTCVQDCPSTALQIFGQWKTVENVLKEVAKDKVYYDKSDGGITLSGGEPTVQFNFTLAFLKHCKAKGIATAIETCGFASKDTYEKMLPYLDLVLYDIKEIDPVKHKQFTGQSNDKILENAIWMVKRLHELQRRKIWIRTPIIPGYTATDENIQGIAHFIKEKLQNQIDRWDLLAFNNLADGKYDRMDQPWELKGTPIMNETKLQHYADLAQAIGVMNVHWSGFTKKNES